MHTIEKSIVINLPVRTVYNQWTQFEQFPKFMHGVKEVRQHGDVFLHWTVSIGGKVEEWEAEIVEQMPDKIIAWRSAGGAPNAGCVRFESIDLQRSRLLLRLDYEPHGLLEKIGDLAGAVEARVVGDLKRFRDFIEGRGIETGAWRGAIHHRKRTE